MAVTNRKKWEKFQSDYWEAYKAEYPAFVGKLDRSCRHKFFRESLEDYRRRYEKSDEFLNQLADIRMNDLSEEDRISYQIVRRELQQIRQYVQLDCQLRPAIFPFGPDMYISYYGVDNITLFSLEDANDYLVRMGRFSKVFTDMQQRLQKGLEKGYVLPTVLLERVIDNISTYIGTSEEDSFWYKPFKSSFIENAVGIAKLQSEAKICIREHIQPAYQNFVNYLRGQYALNCSDSISCYDQPNGKAFYQYLIRYHTSLNLPPEKIHQVGVEEVARIHKEIQAVAEEAGYQNDLDGFHHFMNNDPQFFLHSKGALKERIDALSKRIDRRIPEFFGRLPRITYGVESIPEELARQRPVAFAQSNPADGTVSGIHWITSLPERCPTYMHIPLALHEAWPGHLLHMALMQEIESLPLFRRTAFFNYNAYFEGWALYCERLGLDMELYQTPYEHYGRLSMEMWRAVRLVVDTGIHAKGWSRQQAINYMRQHLMLSDEVIEVEVDRYIGDPGQALSYKLGELKILELRQRANDALGDGFVLRDFHDCVLATGPVTLQILEEQVQRWIDKLKTQCN